MKILLLMLLGVGIGLVGGLVGIGGGVLLIPALTLLFDFNQRQAAGITLAVLAVPVTLPGAWQYFKGGFLTVDDLRLAGILAVAFALGTYLGARLQGRIEPGMLRLLFSLLIIFVGVRMLLYSSPPAVFAAAGLVSTAGAWLAFLFLRALGRKHLTPSALGEQIRQQAQGNQHPDEYYI